MYLVTFDAPGYEDLKFKGDHGDESRSETTIRKLKLKQQLKQLKKSAPDQAESKGCQLQQQEVNVDPNRRIIAMPSVRKLCTRTRGKYCLSCMVLGKMVVL